MSSKPSAAPATQNQFIYRSSVLGSTLTSAIDDLKQEVPDEIIGLEERIMVEFDKIVALKFKELNSNSLKLKLSGTCSSYNNCDDVWQFVMKHCEIKGDGIHESSNHCKIIAMDSSYREGEKPKVVVKKGGPAQIAGSGGYRGGRNGGGQRRGGNQGFKKH